MTAAGDTGRVRRAEARAPGGALGQGLRAALAVLFTGVLVACGSSTEDLEATEAARGLINRGADREAQAAGQAAVLAITRDQVDAAPIPLIRVRIEGTGSLSTMTIVDAKANGSTWAGPDQAAFMFRNGVLIGTRGLGQDLMALATQGLTAERAAGESLRQYRYLDGDEVLVTLDVTCVTEEQGRRKLTILERSYDVDAVFQWCRGEEGLSFENHYWVLPGTSVVVQSRQFISPKFRRAEIEALSRQVP